MKLVNPFITLCIFVVILAASSCKKGDTGPAGATGAAGTAGPKGDVGTANVIYSTWLDVAFTYDSANSVYRATIAVPKIDSAMLATGEMKVYFNTNYASAPAIVPIPYFDGGNIINVDFELGKINLIANLDASTGNDSGGIYQEYRYILIPGGQSARSAVDWNNYASVKAYLHLKD